MKAPLKLELLKANECHRYKLVGGIPGIPTPLKNDGARQLG